MTVYGVLIAESLRVGAELSELPLTVLGPRRAAAADYARNMRFPESQLDWG